jgi:hypothetical protein
MKNRKFIAILLVLALAVCVFPISAFAENIPEANTWSIETSPSGEKYLFNKLTGEKTIAAYRPDDKGNLVEVSLEECLEIKNSMMRVSGTSAALADNNYVAPDSANYETVIYDYRQSSTSVGYGTPIKVSADVTGPATISYLTSKTVSCSFGGGISLSAAMQNAIKSGASFSWNTSLSTASSLSYSFSVPSGRTGYIQFTPYLNVTSGNLYQIYVSSYGTTETNLGSVWGKSPKSLSNGFADGLYELVTR